jgi:GntR family transcriptional repressor for pyruvate dehydrogenase complex
MSTQFEPFEENKKFEKIVTLIKQKVLTGEFRHGDRLPSERDLSNALRVSRLAVREAYRTLQIFGIIDIRRGHQGGAFICAPSSQSIIQSISDLFRFQGINIEEWTEARLIFETDIARLAIKRARKEDIARLEQVIEVSEEMAQAGELVHSELIRFHLCLAEVAANKVLYTSYRSMMDLLLSSFLALGVKADHYANVSIEHRRILDALKIADVDNFLQLVESHVKRAGTNLLNIAEKSPLFNGRMT